MKKICIILLLPVLWVACTPAHQASGASGSGSKEPFQQFTEETLLNQPGLTSAQVGLCLYDPLAATYKYNWQSDKYFMPASNTKLFSLYAGLRYLGDSLVGLRYELTDTAL